MEGIGGTNTSFFCDLSSLPVTPSEGKGAIYRGPMNRELIHVNRVAKIQVEAWKSLGIKTDL